MPLVIGFIALLGAILLVTHATTGASWADVIKGNAGQIYRSNAAGSSSTAATGARGSNATGDVNPVPGATGSRLDAGFDVTGKRFLAPFTGTVAFATASDPGWRGGGYVAIRDALNPQRVIYFAEGLLPTVRTGDSVTAGQSIAVPALNPYNSVIGNIEFGPANPNSPREPLAHSARDPVATVIDFYHWVLSLGGPTASQTSNAGYA